MEPLFSAASKTMILAAAPRRVRLPASVLPAASESHWIGVAAALLKMGSIRETKGTFDVIWLTKRLNPKIENTEELPPADRVGLKTETRESSRPLLATVFITMNMEAKKIKVPQSTSFIACLRSELITNAAEPPIKATMAIGAPVVSDVRKPSTTTAAMIPDARAPFRFFSIVFGSGSSETRLVLKKSFR